MLGARRGHDTDALAWHLVGRCRRLNGSTDPSELIKARLRWPKRLTHKTKEAGDEGAAVSVS